MKVDCLHDWTLSPREAMALQTRLAPRVRVARPRRRHFRLIAGADIALDPKKKLAFAAVLLFRYPDRVCIEQHVVCAPLSFPYVPGLLSFREIPALLQAFARLKQTPHAVICDGQGIAHPRRMGLASHLGLCLGITTVGSAKSRFVGEAQGELGATRGSQVPLMLAGRQVGVVLRTRDGVKPLWVSPGHRVDIATAAELVLQCGSGTRLPEPQRAADRLAGEAKRAGQ
jgi:deoxyribonuclease V